MAAQIRSKYSLNPKNLTKKPLERIGQRWYVRSSAPISPPIVEARDGLGNK